MTSNEKPNSTRIDGDVYLLQVREVEEYVALFKSKAAETDTMRGVKPCSKKREKH
jgi:hypothetical protein